MSNKKFNSRFFEKIIGLSLDTSEEKEKALSSIKEELNLSDEEAEKYFDLLVKENQLKPELEK